MPTTRAALAIASGSVGPPLALPAAAAIRVSDIELVLLPSIVVWGKVAPSRLNRPSLRSGISGIA